MDSPKFSCEISITIEDRARRTPSECQSRPQSKPITPYLMCQSWCYWFCFPQTPLAIYVPIKFVAGHRTPEIFQNRSAQRGGEEREKPRAENHSFGNPNWFFSVASVLSAISVFIAFRWCESLPVPQRPLIRKWLFFSYGRTRNPRCRCTARARTTLSRSRAFADQIIDRITMTDPNRCLAQ